MYVDYNSRLNAAFSALLGAVNLTLPARFLFYFLVL